MDSFYSRTRRKVSISAIVKLRLIFTNIGNILKLRVGDHQTEVHFRTERYWNDSRGWFYSYRVSKSNGPFPSQESARSHYKDYLAELTSRPTAVLTIDNTELAYYGHIQSINNKKLSLSFDESISKNHIQQTCEVFIASNLTGNAIECEIACLIYKITDNEIDLIFQNLNSSNMSQYIQLIDYMQKV